MNVTIFDIIMGILLIWAVYRGFKDGLVVQLGGIAGLLIGVYLAFRFGSVAGAKVAEWFGTDTTTSSIIGFIIILILIIIGVAILSRLLSKLFCSAGMSMLVKVGGVILATLKMALILGLLVYSFDWLNRSARWVDEQRLDNTILYRPLLATTEFTFPYIDFVKGKLFD